MQTLAPHMNEINREAMHPYTFKYGHGEVEGEAHVAKEIGKSHHTTPVMVFNGDGSVLNRRSPHMGEQPQQGKVSLISFSSEIIQLHISISFFKLK